MGPSVRADCYPSLEFRQTQDVKDDEVGESVWCGEVGQVFAGTGGFIDVYGAEGVCSFGGCADV